MNPEIKTQKDTQEYWFKEGCYISEVAADQGDTEVSIARARVKPHSATAWHCLRSVAERYIIVAGTGRVELGDSIGRYCANSTRYKAKNNQYHRRGFNLLCNLYTTIFPGMLYSYGVITD